MFRSFSRMLAVLAVVGVSMAVSSTADAGCGSYGHGYARSYYKPLYAAKVYHRVNTVAVAPLPAPPKEDLPSVPAGSTMTLPTNFLGNAPGNVFMVFQNIKLPVQLLKWSPNGVTITLPPMAIKHPVKVRIDVVLPNGSLGHQQRLIVTPPAPVIFHDTVQSSPLPTFPALPASK